MSSKDQDLCPVCGHKVQRTLNGVKVCDACRKFYQAYMKKKSVPECKKDECTITPANRSRSCNYCRFEKCKSLFSMDPDFTIQLEEQLEVDTEPITNATHSDEQSSLASVPDQSGKQLVGEEVLTPENHALELTSREVQKTVEKQLNQLTETNDRDCPVCGHKAQRTCNGVKVCDACRMFFQTHKKRNSLFHCEKKDCLITFANRSHSCNYCRFEKCKSVGMDNEKIVVEKIRTPEKLALELTSKEVQKTIEKQSNQLTENDDCEKTTDESELQKAVGQLALQFETSAKITPKLSPKKDLEAKEHEKPEQVMDLTPTQSTDQREEEASLVVEDVLTPQKLTAELNVKKMADKPEVPETVQQADSQILTPGKLTLTNTSIPQADIGPEEQKKAEPILQAHTPPKLTLKPTLGEFIDTIGKQLNHSSKAETQEKTIDKLNLQPVVDKPGVGVRTTKNLTPALAPQKDIETVRKRLNQKQKKGNQKKEIEPKSQQAVQHPSLPVLAQKAVVPKPTPEEVKIRIENIFELYEYHCPYTSEKIKKIEQKDFEWSYNYNLNVAENRISAWNSYSRLINEELRRLLQFIPRLQMTIETDCLKYMFWQKAFVLFFVWVAPAISKEGFLYEDGRHVKSDSIFHLYGFDIAGKMVKLADEIRELDLSDHDMAMFMSFVFFQPLEENDPLIGRVNTEEYNGLRNAFRQYKSTENLRFHEVAELIPKLNDLNELYKKVVGSYLAKNGDSFPTGDLFNAMFIDAPKC